MLRTPAFALLLMLTATAGRAEEPSVAITVNGSNVSVTVLVQSVQSDEQEVTCEELGFFFSDAPCR